jgi:2-alkyl-3-oxoalkanoate reductase
VKVLVTGATGFLGRHVVAELLRRGHEPRAVVRPGASTTRLEWGSEVEIVRADLRAAGTLDGIAGDAHAVLHLAALVRGDAEEGFTTAVAGTEHLLAALRGSRVRRMVLASSVAVYDWSALRGTVSEDSPLLADPWPRGPYTVAKLWQERVAQRGAAELGLALTILRPGFIWRDGPEALAGVGQPLGRVWLIVGGGPRLPLTHVENCAHCFVTVLEDHRSAGRTYNVVDGQGASPWRFAGTYRRAAARRFVRVPLPYPVARGLALAAAASAHALFEHGGRLPSALDPPRAETRFKPVRWTSERLERDLGWRPPLSFDQAAHRIGAA